MNRLSRWCPAFAASIVALLIALGAVRAPSEVRGQESNRPGEKKGDGGRLKALLEGTGLKYESRDDTETKFLVTFAPSKVKGHDAWAVIVAYNNQNRNYVLVLGTMLKSKGDMPARVLRAAMEYNSKTPGSKMAYDKNDQSIDVQYEVPTPHLTSDLLAWAIKDVASTCDDQYNTFNELLGE